MRRHLAGPHDFAARLTGRTVVDARRRGKYLWLALDEGDAVLCHLGMSGQFLLGDPDAEHPRHLRIALDLDDGRRLLFADQRIFGGMAFSEDGAELPPEIAHIARDPLDPQFDAADVHRPAPQAADRRQARAARPDADLRRRQHLRRRGAVAHARCTTPATPGTCARARSRPARATSVEVMREALDQGGTSFDALYVNVNGESGYFERSLAVYGQEG